ncbi:hypothetical protein BDF22DRAFT_79166 [Syncephalis plumigaleata]|nr:hypothetical protein BDF22DRAFT_79166 [Syncephalis plumigaleata]
MSSDEDTTADSTDISEEDTAFDSDDDDDDACERSTQSTKSRNRCIRRDTIWAMSDCFNDDDEINQQLVVQLNALVRSETLYVRALTMLRDAFWRSIDEERIAEGNGLRRSGRRLLNVLTSAVHRRKPRLRQRSSSTDESSSDRAEPNTTINGDQLMNGSDTLANRWHKPSWCVCGRREITERGMCALHGLFSNIAPLAECHMRFLLKMRRLQPLSEHLDEFLPLLYEHLLACKVYVIYLNEHIEALVNFENILLCDERLSKEIARCEAQVGVKLRALLTKPVERPWYYAHVVQAIFNNYLPKAKLPAQVLAACVSESTNLTDELETM